MLSQLFEFVNSFFNFSLLFSFACCINSQQRSVSYHKLPDLSRLFCFIFNFYFQFFSIYTILAKNYNKFQITFINSREIGLLWYR